MAKETAALRKHKAKIASLGMDSDTVFHKSRLLLASYRDVTWAISERLEEIRDYAYETGAHDLDAGIRYLAEFAPDIEADKFAERVCCVCETRMYITSVWGPPQSGKTTLAIDLSHAFSQHGKSVCLISPEPYSELTARMSIRIPRARSLAQAYGAPGNLKQVVFEASDLLYVLAASWDADAFDEEPSNAGVKELLRQAEEVFDCVVVDCPSGSGNALAARALNMAEKVILLSGGSGVSAMWYGAFRRSIEALSDRTICVCNQVAGSYDYLGLCKLIRQNPEVFIPHYPDIASIQTMKHTLYGSTSKNGKEYTEGLDKIIDKLEVTAQ